MLRNSSNTFDADAFMREHEWAKWSDCREMVEEAYHLGQQHALAQAEAAQPTMAFADDPADQDMARVIGDINANSATIAQGLREYARLKMAQAEAASKQECCGNPLRGCAECPPRKLTFEEWWEENESTNFWSEEDLAQSVWQAAQENKE